MTEEEKKAIERLTKANNDIWYATLYSQEEQDKDIDIVLNLIQKQQEEIEKKDKQIDLMARELKQRRYIFSGGRGNQCIKEYFEKKAEETI